MSAGLEEDRKNYFFIDVVAWEYSNYAKSVGYHEEMTEQDLQLLKEHGRLYFLFSYYASRSLEIQPKGESAVILASLKNLYFRNGVGRLTSPPHYLNTWDRYQKFCLS